ncbi:chromo-domain-containing protein [Basidiobolus meristosporus CBS 931.73]|uniref:Chromo-domain-containing protein n=1 Tax=Basidiobolus meristosporus CBS 931.73 TaxID=1314790 RepID=A0A1Y1WZY5_9FUNG|nr:chromo-domain-containing protein [Basidiobolus meristosporus CBS 931.73]|eukprot:ORX79111.1 chromo-domain-containing protein [Basidiobolus meristosporus CBS 931.73]
MSSAKDQQEDMKLQENEEVEEQISQEENDTEEGEKEEEENMEMAEEDTEKAEEVAEEDMEEAEEVVEEEEEAIEENSEEEEEEEEEAKAEVYVVEKVVNHRKRKGKTQYLLKWKGYPEEENTWEDEENLFCHELIEKYLKSKETPKKTRTPKSKVRSNKRRRTESSDEESVAPQEQSADEEDSEDWESLVKEVETVERDESDQLKVYLIWNNGKRTVHDAEDANKRCPQKVIAFYEAHLRFKAA